MVTPSKLSSAQGNATPIELCFENWAASHTAATREVYVCHMGSDTRVTWSCRAEDFEGGVHGEAAVPGVRGLRRPHLVAPWCAELKGNALLVPSRFVGKVTRYFFPFVFGKGNALHVWFRVRVLR